MKKLLPISALLALLAAAPPPPGPRPPAVAGHFYPAAPKALAELVDGHLAQAGEIRTAGELVALLVPHAGLEFSGATAARAFAALRPGAFDSVIVVGTCHYKELDGAAIYPGDYATPEGTMRYDGALADALRRASPKIVLDAKAHKKEHSIEVQVPYLRRRLGPKAKLVALVINSQDLETARSLGRALAAAARGRRVLLVASSDLSHYPAGGFADAVDGSTLEALATLDPGFFWLTNRFLLNRGVPHLSVTYCGEGAVTAVAAAARELGATKMSLLGRINSGDVVSERDYRHVVGYASAVFSKDPQSAPGPRALDEDDKKELLRLARKALEEAAAKGGAPRAAVSARPRLNLPAALFVSARDGKGKLLGCLGSAEPQDSLAEAVVRHAAGAATADPRFPRLTPEQAAAARLEISLLSQARAAALEQIKPGDGVVLDQGGRQGVFLPRVWDELKGKESFLGELCEQKAKLPRDCWRQPTASFKTFSVATVAE